MGPGWQANNYGPTTSGVGGVPAQNGTYDPTNPLPGQFIDANGGRFYVLGSDPKTGNPIWSSFVSDKGNTVVIGGRLVDAGTGQVLADFSSGAGGGGESLSPNTVYSNQQQNARDAAQLAQQQQQFLEKFGMDKAINDQTQQLKQGEALGYYNGKPTLERDRLSQDQSQFNTKTAIDYYTKLANLAANPRNFVELLNVTRGVPAPANSAQYSNVAQYQRGNPNIPMPSFMSPVEQRQPVAQQAAANPQSQVPGYNAATQSTGYTSPYQGLSGFNTDGTLRLAPNDPDKERLMAAHPGQYRVGFAQGGVLPEPIVGRGLISGKTYTFNEKGPEGVVPADMLPKFLQQRHGRAGAYANGGMLGFDAGDSYNPNPQYDPVDPYTAPTYTGPNDPSNPYSNSYNPYDVQTTQAYGPQVPTGYGSVMTPGVDYSAIGASLAAAADASNPNIQPTPARDITGAGLYGTPTTPTVTPTTSTVSQTPTVDPYANLVQQSTGRLGGDYFEKVQPGIAYDPTIQTIRQPTQLPQGGGTPTTDSTLTSSVGGTVTPRDVAAPGTFGNISGNRPTFLPGEDMGGTIGQLIASGMLPAFMTRLLGQARGDQSVGTNTPQPFDLPAGLPLTSSLALAQMTPSERAALESIVSSYGIPWEDYVAQVTASSPSGAATQLPAFGQPFLSYRQ